jgi:VIT1/CCC1 family predicted Fe2+/Mn2+ transporter
VKRALEPIDPVLEPSELEAMHVSNAIAVVLLFVAGYQFGRITGRPPVVVGMAMVVFGAALVGPTIALGG